MGKGRGIQNWGRGKENGLQIKSGKKGYTKIKTKTNENCGNAVLEIKFEEKEKYCAMQSTIKKESTLNSSSLNIGTWGYQGYLDKHSPQDRFHLGHNFACVYVSVCILTSVTFLCWETHNKKPRMSYTCTQEGIDGWKRFLQIYILT